MIRMVTGLMGGGKTYFMVKKIVEELRFSERFVVTNCRELDLPRLNEYLQEVDRDDIESGRKNPVDLHSRLLVLEREMVPYFFRFRSGGLVLPLPPSRETVRPWSRELFNQKIEGYFLPVVSKPEFALPVTYFLTEFHDHFNAQDWQDVGPAAQYYISKHRHLHDELVFETQVPEQVDAACRRLVEETHEIVNFYRRSVGPFKSRGHFQRKVYFKEKKPSSVAYETAQFYLDPKGIGSCYHTTGSLGLMDRGAEKKGFGRMWKLPWWTMWVGGAAVILALFVALQQIPRVFGKIIGGTVAGVHHGIADKVAAMPASVDTTKMPKRSDIGPPDRDARANSSSPGFNRDPRVSPQGSTERVTVRGYVAANGKINVLLSDGRILTEGDPSLESVSRAGAVVDGQRLYMAKWVPTAPVVLAKERPAAAGSERVSADTGVEPEAKTSSPEVSKPTLPVSSSVKQNPVSPSPRIVARPQIQVR